MFRMSAASRGAPFCPMPWVGGALSPPSRAPGIFRLGEPGPGPFSPRKRVSPAASASSQNSHGGAGRERRLLPDVDDVRFWILLLSRFRNWRRVLSSWSKWRAWAVSGWVSCRKAARPTRAAALWSWLSPGVQPDSWSRPVVRVWGPFSLAPVGIGVASWAVMASRWSPWLVSRSGTFPSGCVPSGLGLCPRGLSRGSRRFPRTSQRHSGPAGGWMSCQSGL